MDVTLDNLKITGGFADDGWISNYGGGIYSNGMLTLTNSTVFSNTADYGGGLNNNGDIVLANVIISDNVANYGGGFYTNLGIPLLNDVKFINNYASYSGGGLRTSSSLPALTNVHFTNNESGDYGGGMSNNNSEAALNNVIFSGNSTVNLGAGMFNYGSDSALTNTVFLGNFATHNGSGLYNTQSSDTMLTNVTFSGNSAGSKGGGIENQSSSLTLRNTILWNNIADGVTGTITASIIYDSSSPVTITHSLVEASGGGEGRLLETIYEDLGGNIDEDPLFITPVDPSTSPTTIGNLRLKEASPAIDEGNNNFVIGVTSDLDEKARIKNGDGDGTETVDMGAYEAPGYYQLSVSKSGAGSGLVSSIPAGIDCDDICSALMYESAPVILSAVPDKDSIFLGWSGLCSGIGKCELTVDAPKTVTAVFELGLSHYLPLMKR